MDLFPFAWQLLTRGLQENREESGPDELLYTWGVSYWQNSDSSNQPLRHTTEKIKI